MSLFFSTLGPEDQEEVLSYLKGFEQEDGIWAKEARSNLVRGLSGALFLPGQVHAARDAGLLSGLLWTQRREWDSAHFGLGIAHVNTLLALGDYVQRREVKEFMLREWLSLEGADFDYLIIRLQADDLSGAHSVEANGFRFLTSMATLYWPVSKEYVTFPSSRCTPFRAEQVEDLKDIAARCFKYSRFHMEPGWSRRESDELHVKWIENCCRASLADEVLVVHANDRPAGFVACKLERASKSDAEPGLGDIVLLGVANESQGRGIGTELVHGAQSWFADKAFAVQVRTEAHNYPSIRTYQKAGFRLVENSLYFRRWIRSR